MLEIKNLRERSDGPIQSFREEAASNLTQDPWLERHPSESGTFCISVYILYTLYISTANLSFPPQGTGKIITIWNWVWRFNSFRKYNKNLDNRAESIFWTRENNRILLFPGHTWQSYHEKRKRSVLYI